jgi:hypothetical protein
MNPVIRRVIRVGATVILWMFAAVILFLFLVGCSSFAREQTGVHSIAVEAEGTFTSLTVECGIEEIRDVSETEKLPTKPPAP